MSKYYYLTDYMTREGHDLDTLTKIQQYNRVAKQLLAKQPSEQAVKFNPVAQILTAPPITLNTSIPQKSILKKRKQITELPPPPLPKAFDFSGTTIPLPPKPEEKKEERKPMKPVSEKKKQKLLAQLEKESDIAANQLAAGKVSNCYETINKKYLPDDKAKQYKNYSKLLIKLPFQGLLIGATGSGKTNMFRELIKGINFQRIFLCAKNLDEPLYKELIDKYKILSEKLGEQMIWTYDRLDLVPDVLQFRSLLGDKKGIFVCDDFVTEPKKILKEKIEPLFSQGRKVGAGGLSCIFISQGFYETPIFIRKNSKLICLGTITSAKDFTRIVSECTLDITAEQLQYMHKRIQQENTMNFLTIDLTKTKPDEMYLKYRKNFDNPNDHD
jgi:hypothetical protein